MKNIKKDEFRRNKITKHPAYIYEQEGKKYKHLNVTHAPITQGVKNVKLFKNPDPKDKAVAYVRPKANKTSVKKFHKKERGWKMSKKDKTALKRFFK